MNPCQAAATGSPWVNAAVIVTALGALVFCVSYAWRTRGAWHTSPVGRNVMALMAVILVVSALGVTTIVWGFDWPHRDVIRFAAWSLIALVVWWRVVILYRVQHRKEPPS